MTQLPLVSVVTPVYNGEAYLPACIESVLAQTYPNWDYTIVNNCSTDGTLAIAREYAARDPRIRVWNSDHFVRVEQNYNNAFRQISPESKYCKVVAADDWLATDCLEKMVDLAEQNPSVAIVGAYGLAASKVEWQGLPFSTKVVPGRDLCRDRLRGGPYLFGSATSVLFRSDVVRERHAFFNEANFHCDSEACLEVLEQHDFGFVHQVLTFQGVRKDSLTSFSQRMQTYVPEFLFELVRYGPRYLGEEELSMRIDRHLRFYYRFLAQQVFERKAPEFWNYHRREMEKLGYPLDMLRLVTSVVALVFEKASPRNVARGMVWPFRRLFSPVLH